MEAERGRGLLDAPELEREEELWTGDPGGDHEGWSCVATDPFPCPAAGCTFVAKHMTAAHLILVWEQRDDPNLLRHAQRAKEVGRNPRVVVYVVVVRPQRFLLRLGSGGPTSPRHPRGLTEQAWGERARRSASRRS